ncbi:MAG: hypothetical protein H6552_05660 [Chitinophagales bacterium]|nr:hypothetical protein [Chitinophagales bacterium]
MTRIILILTLIFGLNSFLTAQSVPEPEFAMRPYYLGTDNTLKNLERVDAQFDFKAKVYAGTEIYYTAFGKASDIRFSKDALPQFIIKVEQGVDPYEMISLGKAEIKKDRRRFLQSRMAKTGKTKDVSGAYLELEFKKIRDGLFEIILPNNIEVGEYAFMPISKDSGNIFASYGSKAKITCFGID